MTGLKKICKRLLYPPIWAIVLLTVISAAALTAVFVCGLDEHPLSYVVYVVAFYTLTVITLFSVRVLPGYIADVKKRVYENKYGNRYMTDPTFRTRISLNTSLAANLFYAVINVVSGILSGSAWYAAFASYYVILVVIRALLVRYDRANSIGEDLMSEWRIARACAAILTLINIALTVAILMMLYYGRGFEYRGMLIFAMAAYTFYITVLAVVNVIKYRKYHSPVMSVTKITTLAAALVSMLSLESAMLNAFGTEMAVESKRLFIALTGAGISAVVLAMSSYMIIRSVKEIEKLKKENNDDKRK